MEDSQLIAVFITVPGSRRRNSAEKLVKQSFRFWKDTFMNINQVLNKYLNEKQTYPS